MAAAGSREAPDKLQSRTATVLVALIRMMPVKPVSRPAGQPAATESPGEAPDKPSGESPHAPAAITPKSITPLTVKYVGTEAESTATMVCDPVSSATIPVPLP